MTFKWAALILSSFFLLTGFTDFNVPEICAATTHDTALDDGQKSLGLPAALLETGTPQAIADQIQGKRDPLILNIAPWLLQDVTHPNISRAGYLLQGVHGVNLINHLSSGKTINDVLTAAAATPAHYSPAAQSLSQQWMDRLLATAPSPNLEKMKTAAPGLCLPYKSLKCVDALRDVIDLMGSRDGGLGAWVSLMPVVQRFLMDDGLTQGAAHYALKFLTRLQRHQRINDEPGHLFEDLVSSFLATGSTQAQAVDRAWVIVGMYGTRGASLSFLAPMANAENMPVFLSAYLFSASLGLMDNQTLPTGSPYSFPSGLRTQCAYSYPYHYWLSAYLSHALRAKGYDARNSVIASHLVGKLYEWGSGSLTRDTERPYRDKFFNRYNVQLQMNLAFDDAGAFFGAGVTSQVVVDKGLLIMFETAKPMPVLTPDELEKGLHNDLTRYQWFNQVIAPDAWVDAVYKIDGN